MSRYKVYYNSPIGLLEIEAEKNGITNIRFDKMEEPVYLDPDGLLVKCLDELNEYFTGRRKTFDVKIDPQGTEFQTKVWNEVYKIPFGKTKSYLDIAKYSGDPNNIRAVGGANGRNKIPIIIPCHRVIGANGLLVGYSGGVWRKKWLLNFEGSNDQLNLL